MAENEVPETEQNAEPTTAEREAAADETPAAPGYSGTSYVENPQHVPDPTAMTGTVETSGTGGATTERLSTASRIFGDAEEVIRHVEAIAQQHISDLITEVRGLLLHRERTAVVQNLPQQTVEDNGVATHQGNIVTGANDTGAAQDSVPVAGSPADVSAGTVGVAEGGQDDTYAQQTIAGARNPQEPVQAAQEAGVVETPEAEQPQQEQGETAEGEQGAEVPEAEANEGAESMAKNSEGDENAHEDEANAETDKK